MAEKLCDRREQTQPECIRAGEEMIRGGSSSSRDDRARCSPRPSLLAFAFLIGLAWAVPSAADGQVSNGLELISPETSYTELVVNKNGETEIVTAQMTQVAGGTWQVRKEFGAEGSLGQSSSTFKFNQANGAILAELTNAIKCNDPSIQTDTNGSAIFGVRLTGGESAPTSAMVKVDIYRSIIPQGGVSGIGLIDDIQVGIDSRPWMQHEEYIYEVVVDDTIPLPALSGELSVSGVGAIYATSSVVVSIVGEGGATLLTDSSQPDADNPDDDEVDDEDPCDEGSNAGDALHLRLPTGNVWTEIPVCMSHANDGVEFDLSLRYDTLRAHEVGPLGFGWTHSYNLALAEKIENGIEEFIYRTGSGRRHAFVTNGGGGFITPPGRNMILTRPDGVTSKILYPNGDAYSFDDANQLTTIVDRRGRITRFNYSNGKLSSIVSPNGRQITFTYYANAFGHLWKITDPDQKVTEFTYDEVTRDLLTITDPLGGVVSYEYDASHRITKETLKNGKFYLAAYDGGSHRLLDSNLIIIASVSGLAFPEKNTDAMGAGAVNYTDGRGNDWTITRDNLGRLRGVRSPNSGPSQSIAFGGPQSGPDRNRRILIVDELGHQTQTKWDSYGNVLERIDAESNVERYQYGHKRFHDLVTKHTEPDLDVWNYNYDPDNGDLLSIIDPIVESPTPGQDKVIGFTYETHTAGSSPSLPGRIKKITRTNRNGHQTVREYDTSGNLVTLTRAAGQLDLITTCTYDPMGRTRVETVERGDQQIVREYTWDAMGRMLNSIEDATQNGLELTTTRGYDLHGNLTSITNPRGYKTTYSYDHRNRQILEVVDDRANGLDLVSQWFPDGNGNIIRYTDPNLHVTGFEYNERDELKEMRDAENYRTVFIRDDAGRLERVDRALTPGDNPTDFRSASFTYDALNRLRTQTVAPDTLALTTQYEYTSPGGCACNPATPGESLPHKVIDPKGKVTFLNYDRLDRMTSVVRKVGAQHDAPLGDSDDAISAFDYDPFGNLIAMHGPEGELTTYEYDAAERAFSRTVHDAVHGPQRSFYDHDGTDNVRQVLLPNGNTLSVDYDAADRLESVTDTLGLISRYEYDANGNVHKRFDGLQHFWEYAYDPDDRLIEVHDPIIESPDKFTSFSYDNAGNLTLETNNRGIATRYVFDDIDRMIEMVEDYRDPPNLATPTDNSRTMFGFDGINQVSITDHDGNATGYEYDDALRLKKIIYPSPGGAIEYDYDAVGNLFSRVDQRGILTLFDHDDLHHLTHRYYPTRTEEFAFDRSNRLRRAKNDWTESLFSYDEADRLDVTSQAYLTDPATYTTAFDYVVAADDLRRMTHYPAGRIVTHTMDERFRLASVAGGTNVGATWGHDLANRRTASALGNGINSVFEYDLNDRLTKVQHAKDAASVFDIDYGYDESGNRLWKRFNAVGVPNDLTDRSEVYTYDNRDRLASMSRGAMAPGTATIATPLVHPVLAKSQQWQNLDRRGNWREFREMVGASSDITQTREPNAVNQYTSIDLDGPGGQSPVTPQSDAAGNMTEDPTARSFEPAALGQKYEYDEENRLVVVGRVSDDSLLMEIHYDAVGRRVETIQHNDSAVNPPLTAPRHTRHIYDGLETIEEYECGTGVPACDPEDWDLAREFIWGARFPESVAMVDHVGGAPVGWFAFEWVYYYALDALGNVVGLTDELGTLRERYTYDPYGKTYVEYDYGYYDGWGPMSVAEGKPTFSIFGNPFMWTGQRYDAGVQLYHFMFRSYSPGLGRWMQQDPLGYVDGVTLYEYVLSAPVDWTDPLGLEASDLDAEIEAQTRHAEGVKKSLNAGSGAVKKGLEVAARLNPVSDVVEAVTGKDIITGEKSSKGERIITIVGFIPIIGLIDDFNDARKVKKVLNAADGVKDAKKFAKSTKGVKKLKTYKRGAPFSKKTKEAAKAANKAKNKGKLRSEISGEELVKGKRHKKGVRPPDNEAHVDHKKPKSKGGTNHPRNARVISRKENLRKGAKKDCKK